MNARIECDGCCSSRIRRKAIPIRYQARVLRSNRFLPSFSSCRSNDFFLAEGRGSDFGKTRQKREEREDTCAPPRAQQPFAHGGPISRTSFVSTLVSRNERRAPESIEHVLRVLSVRRPGDEETARMQHHEWLHTSQDRTRRKRLPKTKAVTRGFETWPCT